jgi:hypothetical protein
MRFIPLARQSRLRCPLLAGSGIAPDNQDSINDRRLRCEAASVRHQVGQRVRIQSTSFWTSCCAVASSGSREDCRTACSLIARIDAVSSRAAALSGICTVPRSRNPRACPAASMTATTLSPVLESKPVDATTMSAKRMARPLTSLTTRISRRRFGATLVITSRASVATT